METPSPYFDHDLLRRYDAPGPRYASYPTASQFRPDFGEPELKAMAAISNGDPIPLPLSLSVHLPLCSTPRFHCADHRIITQDQERSATYLMRLYREAALASALFDRDREVEQVHFGGGTPRFPTPAQIAETLDVLQRMFCFARGGRLDCSIELDPCHITPEGIAELAAAGFNRTSLDVQDFDPDVQRAVNRVHSVESTLDIIAACRRHGVGSINVNLVYGLPAQTLEGFSRTLDITLGTRPDRISVYDCAHVPSMFRGQQRIHAEDLIAPEAKLRLLECAIEKLCGAGYVHIGMDLFALPQDELAVSRQRGRLHRNLMGYTSHADSDLIGLGVGAISRIGPSFSQNPRKIARWEDAVDRGHLPVRCGIRLDEDDQIRADAIQSLMCHGHLDFEKFSERHLIHFHSYFGEALARLAQLHADGLVVLSSTAVSVTSRGRFLLRIIAMCFDRYLPTAATGVPADSRSA